MNSTKKRCLRPLSVLETSSYALSNPCIAFDNRGIQIVCHTAHSCQRWCELANDHRLKWLSNWEGKNVIVQLMLSHPPSLSGIVYREHGNAGNFSHQWLVLLNLQYPRGDGKPVRSIFSEVKSRVGGRCNQNLPPNLDLSNRTEIPPWIKTKYSNLFPCLPLCGIKEIACRKNSFLWRHPIGFCRQHLLQTEVGFVIGAARESLFREDAWQVIPDRYCFTSSLNFDRIRESESVRKQINDREPREIRGRLRHCERWQVSISHWP